MTGMAPRQHAENWTAAHGDRPVQACSEAAAPLAGLGRSRGSGRAAYAGYLALAERVSDEALPVKVDGFTEECVIPGGTGVASRRPQGTPGRTPSDHHRYLDREH